MEGVDGLESDKVFDLEETIFVAVGKNVENNKRLLFWVLQSFAGKKICLLYVHRPANVLSFSEFSFLLFSFNDVSSISMLLLVLINSMFGP